jgi:hypothetical protein
MTGLGCPCKEKSRPRPLPWLPRLLPLLKSQNEGIMAAHLSLEQSVLSQHWLNQTNMPPFWWVREPHILAVKTFRTNISDLQRWQSVGWSIEANTLNLAGLNLVILLPPPPKSLGLQICVHFWLDHFLAVGNSSYTCTDRALSVLQSLTKHHLHYIFPDLLVRNNFLLFWSFMIF